MRFCGECRMPWPTECLCDDPDDGAGVDWSTDEEDAPEGP